MKLADFYIGLEFTTGDGTRFRCTDVGSRVVVAIDLNGPDEVTVSEGGVRRKEPVPPEMRTSWHRGPPYAVVEMVFDESDLPACKPCSRRS